MVKLIKNILFYCLIVKAFILLFFVFLFMPIAIVNGEGYLNALNNIVNKILDQAEYIALYPKEDIDELRREFNSR